MTMRLITHICRPVFLEVILCIPIHLVEEWKGKCLIAYLYLMVCVYKLYGFYIVFICYKFETSRQIRLNGV